MKQEIKNIPLKDLILWTENPRDPFDENAADLEIIKRAIEDCSTKWKLESLAREMGSHYDFSEIPTVVYHGKKPIVYDGNRRIVLGKIKHKLVKVDGIVSQNLPDFPEKIPCNVCTKVIALENILRKHGDSGSWLPLERDVFLHKHMGHPKSALLIIEENTSLISSNPHLNQRFVKEEIFKEDILKKLGFNTMNGTLRSTHNNDQSEMIFSDISDKIQNKVISTRKNRGRIIDVLEPSSRKIIDDNQKNKTRTVNFKSGAKNKTVTNKKQPRRTRKNTHDIFGGKLYIKTGIVGDIYRDISDLYKYYLNNKDVLSSSFPNLIRMSLRLLCEAAAKDKNKNIDKYLDDNFDSAKDHFDKDTKTTLANQSINKKSIRQLLHTGAHNYSSSSNIEQTIAISIILGEIITLTHGQGDGK